MDEFDIDIDSNSNIGTSVSKIKNKEKNINSNLNNDTIKHTETDIDYDKAVEILHNTETNHEQIKEKVLQPTDNFISCIQDVRPKREISINKMVKNIESDIDIYNKINFNEPLPVNFNKNMNHPTQNLKLETFNQVIPNEIMNDQPESKKEPSLGSKKMRWVYLDIIIYVLIFMLLNNKFIIELIYTRVPYIKTIKNPYLNLILRSIVFGLLIFLIKKFNHN